MGNLILRTQEVTKTVRVANATLNIISDISVQIELGASISITGPSGAGKSTLLGLLAGLDEPSSGQIWIDENEITQMDEEARAKIRAQLVGFVFQTFQLLGSLTALENVALPMELVGQSYAQERAVEYLTKVGLGDRTRHYPRQLSGGEQQRVAIARAFACEPKILFADEPTGNLDAANSDKIEKLLFELNQNAHTTLVLVTHDQALAEKCQRQLHMQAGELTEVFSKTTATDNISRQVG